MRKSFVTGGAGFIGSHLVRKLLTLGHCVTVFDNFSNGHRWHFESDINNRNLNIIECDIAQFDELTLALKGQDQVFHLASNADISKAMAEPSIDFTNGTVLTKNILEAMRINEIKKIFYTSGSGVYGEVPSTPIPENYSNMLPISTYGAQKLASESLISAYSHMFGITGTVFRFANVVGPRQTHGVIYDFVKKLFRNNQSLEILGDGSQSKPYIYVDDVISAFVLAEKEFHNGYQCFNVASDDSMTVNQIADLTCQQMNLKNVNYLYTGGSRGWLADVPFYKLDTSKIRKFGWKNQSNSYEAVTKAIQSIILDVKNRNIKI
jgi:UDP-glucose 4-epimerase